ncbi:hypothetical protein [Mucilaginibacter aquariorum]|uniref:CPBP family intramembrane metalloprotease n=1 Tax=Mucilaginibacter aquariorum TaxID=2967225 RepID=A0ABT1SVY5_9SPHI|nr:hypothetical protein [Mucilaginibacter aquariorum]MCQ6956493.1 hypothetical protein [Mucilaginibacter aquariorum]
MSPNRKTVPVAGIGYLLTLVSTPTLALYQAVHAIEAGLLLGSAYVYSCILWLPIAIHFAWNFVQSGVLGAVTSGNDSTSSWLTTQLTGPGFIIGGKFGPEGTIQAKIFCPIAAGIFMYLNIKNKKLIRYGKSQKEQ